MTATLTSTILSPSKCAVLCRQIHSVPQPGFTSTATWLCCAIPFPEVRLLADDHTCCDDYFRQT
jgi:hypothetical protein